MKMCADRHQTVSLSLNILLSWTR